MFTRTPLMYIPSLSFTSMVRKPNDFVSRCSTLPSAASNENSALYKLGVSALHNKGFCTRAVTVVQSPPALTGVTSSATFLPLASKITVRTLVLAAAILRKQSVTNAPSAVALIATLLMFTAGLTSRNTGRKIPPKFQ
ncbi:hypothetical protein SDC9_171729 [bioreactor metagenome]|uniref:Uncharacterized protein n=1 Tax=bioreactor metagenome TaxID=1076179 RepID=A0A645GE92_9ZZZZ